MLGGSAQKVQAALRASGYANSVIELPQSARSASEAALALGCSVGQIAKSLVFRCNRSGSALLVIASGSNRVDEVRLAELVGEPVERATPEFVRETTGFAIGGVPPLGHATALRTYLDEDLLKHGEIWAAGGSPHAVFKLAAAELMSMTGGKVERVAKR